MTFPKQRLITASLLVGVALSASCRNKSEFDSVDSATLPLPDADGDGFDEGEDCDDTNGEIHPDAEELCDGVDNNCDDLIDDESAVDGAEWYFDGDGDGYGDENAVVVSCDQPEDHVSVAGDCDDDDDDFNPGAVEDDCTDPLDYNCDGSVGYEDADGDGFAACEECDDSREGVNPDSTELCDTIDNDCDGEVDEDDAADAALWYIDADGDGFGSGEFTWSACEAPSGYVDNSDDCDDGSDLSYPMADELCDDLDNDCDGEVDEEAIDPMTLFADADGDGFGNPDSELESCDTLSGYVTNMSDCDDSDMLVSPVAVELCDTIDNDCDGDVDEDDAYDVSEWFSDSDGDGYGDAGSSVVACDAPSGSVADDSDCDDSDSSVNPDADEECDSVDNDCDGDIDEDDAIDVSVWYADLDGDGFGDSSSTSMACSQPSSSVATPGDCDDGDATISPAASEQCDSVDNDCDGTVDESDSTDASLWYADLDGDGYGDSGSSSVSCTQPSLTTAVGGDCDDGDSTISPAASEQCDSVDNDCDGTVDEGDAIDATTWYADLDGDGYGDATSSSQSCSQPSQTVTDSSDCDDSSSAISPLAYEECDSVDNDCDGSVDESDAVDALPWYLDADGDGYGDATSSVLACSAPSGYVADHTDCDDSDAASFPDANGVCVDGTDCSDILAKGHNTSGTYTIDPDGTGVGVDPFDVSCDMKTDGGGWTLMLHLYSMSGLDEDEFIALFGHNRFTEESWHYDASTTSVNSGLHSTGLTLLSGQGAIASSAMSGRWDDLRMGCSVLDSTTTEEAYAQVDGYATTNGTWSLLGASSNGTSYSVDSTLQSTGQSTIWHDNEYVGWNSNHYLCDIYDASSSATQGAPQFGFCYTDFLNNSNTSDMGDSIVSIAFGHDWGSDGWSQGFTGECGDMGSAALQNVGTFSIWVR